MKIRKYDTEHGVMYSLVLSEDEMKAVIAGQGKTNHNSRSELLARYGKSFSGSFDSVEVYHNLMEFLGWQDEHR